LLYIPYKININNCTISKETIIIKKLKKRTKKRERYIKTYMMKVIPETLRNTKLDSNVFIKKGDNKLMAIN
jgi:ribonuclease HII